MILRKLITFTKLLCNPRKMIVYLASHKMLNWLPDKPYLKLFYWGMIGKRLNLLNPKSFNEKLQWLKLYNHNPKYTVLVDKYEVKEYISSVFPDVKVIPTIGIWDSVDDIDFAMLPDQFVLKCTHDSGSIIICKNKDELDINKTKAELKRSLKKDMYKYGREWVYKDVKHRIIAEKYIEDDDSSDLMDYKFMCFNGIAKCCFVCSDRFTPEGLHVTFFDRNWKVMPFTRHYPKRENGIPKPVKYEQMLELAEKMSKGIPFVRIDFYSVKGEIIFGEYTFFPGCGFEEFTPDEWDYKLGEWIILR